uniref:LIP1 protein n=1 Tax=Fopius arisanus TaxID=64838 RepID=A0A0C9RY85_9HYME
MKFLIFFNVGNILKSDFPCRQLREATAMRFYTENSPLSRSYVIILNSSSMCNPTTRATPENKFDNFVLRIDGAPRSVYESPIEGTDFNSLRNLMKSMHQMLFPLNSLTLMK